MVVNNSGGDIFNLIEGPAKQPDIQHYQIAHHPVSIQKLAEAFNLDYFCCENEQGLRDQLSHFFEPNSKAALLEIKTPPGQNSGLFRQLMKRKSLPEFTN
jgi:2-succinyl-5-enolpyruvyl-6-hydroxy-3-cyclohexene-1-carboxylate synthase